MTGQRTLKQEIHAKGVEFQAGEEVFLTIRPAPVDTGIVFRRIDLDPVVEIKAALKQHGLSNQGLNDDLKARLLKVRVNVKDKLEFQTKYKFCIAYENCSDFTLHEGYPT